jgi:putative transposase
MLAILMRDVLYRQGRLPPYVLHDGGSDNASIWFRGFCLATGVSRVKPPAGAAKKNSRAENALGRTNLQLSHRLLGSTAPDKMGRRVDSKIKSYNTACLLFKDIVHLLDTYLFEDLADSPTGNSIGSPREKSQFWGEAFGNVGVVLPYDDNFRIMTSVPVDREISAMGTSGYRHLNRTYRSARLSELLHTGYASEKLRDPVDPTLMYFRFGTEWVSGSSREWSVLRTRGPLDQLFATMSGRTIRSRNAAIREEIGRNRQDRIELANASAPATAHLPKSQTDNCSEQPGREDDDIFVDDELGELTPFPDEEI